MFVHVNVKLQCMYLPEGTMYVCMSCNDEYVHLVYSFAHSVLHTVQYLYSNLPNTLLCSKPTACSCQFSLFFYNSSVW